MSDQQAQELDAALVEIVAQAIFQDDLKDEGGGTWESHDDGEKEAYRSNARAALLAARSVQVERPDEGELHAAIEHYKRQRDENATVAEELAERVRRDCDDYAAYLAAMEALDTEDYELDLPVARLPERPDAAPTHFEWPERCELGQGQTTACEIPLDGRSHTSYRKEVTCVACLQTMLGAALAARLPERPDG